MNRKDSIQLLQTLTSFPKETEWVEFKHNFHSCEEIGERISGLANSAALMGLPYGYLVFGVEDGSHLIVGTDFKAKTFKRGNEELEMWLLNRLSPRIDFECFEFDHEGKHISLYKIPAAIDMPVSFLNEPYIRIGSLTKLLKGYPEKAKKLWRLGNSKPLDKNIIKEVPGSQEVLSLLSIETYFDLLRLPFPHTSNGIIERFISEHFITPLEKGYGITELGAILLAKNFRDFDNLYRKAVRVIVYRGKDKTETVRENIFEQGYAISFPKMVDWVNGQLPSNQEIGTALRKEVKMYPEIAIREIAANMIIHQDFGVLGFPMVEVYADRIEISSPGKPLISLDRFIDEYQSRNEGLADVMRRMGFCEEKGSGMDKATAAIEHYQLPPFKVRATDTRTTVTLTEYKRWADTSREERLLACYQHACLRYLANGMLTNKSFRQRMGVEEKNYAAISRLIKEAMLEGLIKVGTPEGTNRRDIGYIPNWG